VRREIGSTSVDFATLLARTDRWGFCALQPRSFFNVPISKHALVFRAADLRRRRGGRRARFVLGFLYDAVLVGAVAAERPGGRGPPLLWRIALGGPRGTFGLLRSRGTPDLAVHATLPGATYEGKTLQIRGVDPEGRVVWNYPHLQNGESFDAVLPVFGSAAARKHVTGTYSFSLLAPDRTVVAEGKASFTSSRDAARDAGGAPHALWSPAFGERVATAGGE
jgi:hypothetical protein